MSTRVKSRVRYVLYVSLKVDPVDDPEEPSDGYSERGYHVQHNVFVDLVRSPWEATLYGTAEEAWSRASIYKDTLPGVKRVLKVFRLTLATEQVHEVS